MTHSSICMLIGLAAAAITLLPSQHAAAQSQPPPPLIIPSAFPPLALPGLPPPAPKPQAKPAPPLIIPATLPPLPALPALLPNLQIPPLSLPTAARHCVAPTGLPPVRRAGNLTVHSPPKGRLRTSGTRLRSHVEGPLGNSKGRRNPEGRVWSGPEVPSFVPLMVGAKELALMDPIAGGYLALYREPYGGNSCQLGDWDNCDYEVRVFDCNGGVRSALDLNRFMSGRKHLEVADVRYADGIVYFNEACQTYSWQAGGRCSSLVAIDTRTSKRLWRSGFKVSNNVFLVSDRYLITGFGFTGRPASLFLLRRDNGRVARAAPLKTKHAVGGSHDALTLQPGGMLRVGIYESGSDLMFRVAGLDGSRPTLTRVGVVPPARPAERPRARARRTRVRRDPFRGRR